MSTRTPQRAAAAADDGFVPSGDSKLDALRMLLAEKADPARSPTVSTTPARTTTPSRPVAPAAAEPSGADIGRRDRGDTAGGDTTAPGRLADRSRPERLEPESRAFRSSPTPAGREPDRPGRARQARGRSRGDDLQALRRKIEDHDRRQAAGESDDDAEGARGAGRSTWSPARPTSPDRRGAAAPSPSVRGAVSASTQSAPTRSGPGHSATDLTEPSTSPAVTDVQHTGRDRVSTAPSTPSTPSTPSGPTVDSPAPLPLSVDRLHRSTERPDRLARRQALRRAAEVEAADVGDTADTPRPPTVSDLVGRAMSPAAGVERPSTAPPTASDTISIAPTPPATTASAGVLVAADRPAATSAPRPVVPKRPVPTLGHTPMLRRLVTTEAAMGVVPSPDVRRSPTGPVASERSVPESAPRSAGLPPTRREFGRASVPPQVSEAPSAHDAGESSSTAARSVRPPAAGVVAGESTAERSPVDRRRAEPHITEPSATAIASLAAGVEPELPLRRRVSLPRVMSRDHRPDRAPSHTDAPASLARRTAAQAATPLTASTRRDLSVPRAMTSATPARTADAPTSSAGDLGRRLPAPPSSDARSATSRADGPTPSGQRQHGDAPRSPSISVDTPDPPGLAAPAAAPLARRFEGELARRTPATPASLPAPFRPLADAIAPRRRVLLSTDSASQRALRTVRRVAATVGDTIHLDTAAVAPQRMAEVMAHELTHVASPSPVPRFFDDPHDSPEERRAEAVAAVIARSPVAPSASMIGHDRSSTVRRRRADETSSTMGSTTTISSSRSSSSPSSPASSSGSVTAADLAARLTGSSSSSSSSSSTIRRTAASGSGSSPTSTMGSSTPTIRRETATSSGSEATTSAAEPDPHEADRQFEEAFTRNLDRIVRLLRERMQSDLERHGGNFRRGFR